MRYYKVSPRFDGVQVWKMGRVALHIDRELVGGELYTPAELRRLNNGATYRGVRDDEVIFTPVEVPKNRTYWFFGARFASEEVSA